MDDKIKVDEPLISTDVDKLMHVLSEKKKASISELQSACGINRRALDEWIRVLEDENYIRIEYGITGTYIRWLGAGEEEAEEKTPGEPQERKYAISENEGGKAPAVAEKEESDDYTPEELLHKYVTMKRREGEEETDIKSNILKSFHEEDEEDYTIPAEEEKSEGGEQDVEMPAEMESEEDSEDGDAQEKEEMPEPQVEEKQYGLFAAEEEETKETGESEASEDEAPKRAVREAPKSIYEGEVRDRINAYVQEINKEKAKLQALEKQKGELYRDKMVSLDSRMESDMASLMQYILQHESRLLEMKERVLELPDKVEEIARVQTEIRNLGAEGKRSLGETRKKVEGLLESMKEGEKELKGRINDARTTLEREESKVEELHRIRDSIDGKTEKITTVLDSMKERIEELNDKMNALGSELQEATSAKAEIENDVESLRQEMESKGTELDSLEEDLGAVVKLESWIREYVNDYEDKIDAIDAYVRKSDDELAAVKEAAEASYLKKYLGELESITGSYESELDGVVGEERKIEERIADTRLRMASLVKESQQMIRKLKSETAESPDYGEIRKKVEARTAKARRTVEEKAQERGRLSEEVGKRKAKRKNGKKKKN
ncbi:hypothetical protein H0O02_03535 [Candidatus Micrarchaeota archaeon]|nr:hypothetical protein [Candidatus Micrarchaeota archaeon]